MKKKKVLNVDGFDMLIFSREELFLLDSLLEEQMLRCSHVIALIAKSSDSYRYYHVKKRLDDYLKISVKLETLLKQVFDCGD